MGPTATATWRCVAETYLLQILSNGKLQVNYCIDVIKYLLKFQLLHICEHTVKVMRNSERCKRLQLKHVSLQASGEIP